MFQFQPYFLSHLNSSDFDENEWVINVSQALDDHDEITESSNTTIFSVPRILLSVYPHSYIPQHVAIGPYHYTNRALSDMEVYKLSAARRNQKELPKFKLKHFAEELKKFEHKIRACYHKILNFKGETLAWMMAVDASFLFKFFLVCHAKRGAKEGELLTRISAGIERLIELASNSNLAYNAVLRDIVLFENQIPLFVLMKMLEMTFPPVEEEETLRSMLIVLWEEISPFKMVKDFSKIEVCEFAHLLDFIYRVAVPKPAEKLILQIENEEDCEANKNEENEFHIVKYFYRACDLILKLCKGFLHIIKKILCSTLVQLLLKLPVAMFSLIPFLRVLKGPLEKILDSFDEKEKKSERGQKGNNAHKCPLMEEIKIPSVAELSKSGINFVCTSGDIMSIKFDKESTTLYLPTIRLDLNSEILLRNLVAYEACTVSGGPLVLTRYVELMNGIVDTNEDVEILREKGIIVNHLKSDEEAAQLWNGMSRSIRLTRVPFLDKVIEDVNKCHSRMWRVKFGTFTKNYIFGSWKCLTLLAAILLLFLTCLQSFCSVYSCHVILNKLEVVQRGVNY